MKAYCLKGEKGGQTEVRQVGQATRLADAGAGRAQRSEFLSVNVSMKILNGLLSVRFMCEFLE